ncbi:molybdopterin molybdenumtransferase MoeA [Komagataeibacter melaceti]|uniref:Molybdopterin molybdenumtransferase n=1 Tax=Komagataeibacter melaceti TaxID=2766577 RepID=A0A371YXM6_9PROT|nr:molybdopterin molybdotransferase MoeA [Komagataeibacter melaceti]RFD18990.1 molybdopterin molybdenumtransferase MoeA [Komagataeibacter melaceti]
MSGNDFAGQVDHPTALRLVLAHARAAPPATTRVPLAQAAGRVAGADVRATTCRPPADISAMDGYAFAHAAMAARGCLPVDGRTVAGDRPEPLVAGHARAILTGARIPAGADCVMAAERMTMTEGGIAPATALAAHGANIRNRGEEFATGTVLVPRGQVVDWRHVALLASQGVRDVTVMRRPRVCVLSNGAELAADAPGACMDSNGPMLAALLGGAGARVTTHVAASDNVATQAARLRAARAGADVLVTSGGISVGGTDHMLDILRDMGGRVLFRGVSIRPGRPFTVVEHDGALVFCLPGNPGAAAICALVFVLPYLRARMGADPGGTQVPGVPDFMAEAPAGMTGFIPVALHPTGAGWRFSRVETVGSSDIISFTRADALLTLPPHEPARPGVPAWAIRL